MAEEEVKLQGISYIDGTQILRIRVAYKGEVVPTLVTNKYAAGSTPEEIEEQMYERINEACYEVAEEIDNA